MNKRKPKLKDSGPCYFCGRIATTKEHIPPKCFFPKQLPKGKNLITVPSCDKHNNDKSSIDYQQLVLLAMATTEEIDQRFTPPHLSPNQLISGSCEKKINRFLNTINSLIESPIFDTKNKTMCINNNVLEQSIPINMHNQKIFQESILRGLYYHETNQVWTKQIFIYPFSVIRVEADFLEKFLMAFNKTNFTKQVDESNDHEFNWHSDIKKGDPISVINVCINKWYYFFGIFCDSEHYNLLLKTFDGAIGDFNKINLMD